MKHENAKPILFNTEMVRAILDGRKTQTRRVIKNAKVDEQNHWIVGNFNYGKGINEKPFFDSFIKFNAKYQIGDILYVRETWNLCESDYCEFCNSKICVRYKASYSEFDKEFKWKPSIHMPKKYARIFLKVTNVKIERLQDIGYNDLSEEGFVYTSLTTETSEAKKWWIKLWNSTAKDGYKWEDNPYVFVYEFELLK